MNSTLKNKETSDLTCCGLISPSQNYEFSVSLRNWQTPCLGKLLSSFRFIFHFNSVVVHFSHMSWGEFGPMWQWKALASEVTLSFGNFSLDQLKQQLDFIGIGSWVARPMLNILQSFVPWRGIKNLMVDPASSPIPPSFHRSFFKSTKSLMRKHRERRWKQQQSKHPWFPKQPP